MSTTAFLITARYDDGHNFFANSWVCATKNAATASIMQEIINASDEAMRHYWEHENFQKLKEAWETSNLDEIIKNWNTMSSMEFECVEIILDTKKPVVLPEFPWNEWAVAAGEE